MISPRPIILLPAFSGSLEQWILSLILLFSCVRSTAQPTGYTWSKSFDKGSLERISDLAVDPATGYIYAVGSYDHSSLLDLVPGPFGLTSSAGGTDAFLVKLDPQGGVVWTRRLGGSFNDIGTGVAIGPNGKIYITGAFKGSLSNTIIGGLLSLISSTGGSMDIFTACYTPGGTLEWLERAGGSDTEFGHSIAVNNTGVFVQGQFRNASLFGNINVTPPNNGKEHIFLVKYPLTGGDPLWVRQAVNSKDNVAGKIAADENGVFAIGSFKESHLSWRTPANANLGTVNCAQNNQNVYISSFSNAGALMWHVAINEPGSQSAGNAIATGCGRVFISGRIHQGATFPGYGAVQHGSAHDFLYVAGLDAANGNVQWVRTAESTNSHLNEGLDLHVCANKQVYLSATFDQNQSWDDGRTFSGTSGQEILLLRMSMTGETIWARAESASGGELAHAVATDDQGRIVIGGIHTGNLSLPPFSHSGGNNENIFLASTTDPSWDQWANDPSLWDHPGSLCSNSGSLALNTRLRGSLRSVITSFGVNSPEAALGMADGDGATFNDAQAYAVYDLGDTLLTGATFQFSWRRSSIGNCKVQLSYSMNGMDWSDHPVAFETSNSSYTTLELIAPTPFRYLRFQRVSAFAFLIDALITRTSTAYGGTWSGTQVSAGAFDPTGLSGWIPLTYSYTYNGCVWSTTRSVKIIDPNGAGSISGDTIVCSGSAPGTLTLSDHVGPILRWERSTNGFATISNINTTAASITPGPINTTTQWRAVVDLGACGSVNSAPHTVLVDDQTPPELDCPADLVVDATANCQAVVNYTPPVATDNCTGTNLTRISGPASGSMFPIGTTTITYQATDAAGNISTCSFQVTVQDVEPPVLISSLPMTALTLGSNCGAIMPDITAMPLFTDCSAISLEQSPAAGTTITSETTATVTASATGGSTIWTTTIEVVDLIPPTIQCPSDKSLLVDANATTMVVWYDVPEVTDNCGTATITPLSGTLASGAEFPLGTTTITYVAQDPAGNTDTCSFSITLIPNDTPIIQCPSHTTLSTDPGICTADVQYAIPVGEDVQDGILNASLIAGLPPGAFPKGANIVSYMVEDADGNSSTCSMTVTVLDAEAPTLTCPPADTIYVGNPCGASVPDLRGLALVADNCSQTGPTVHQYPAPGTFKAPGIHVVTIKAIDGSGNETLCGTQLIVLDTISPGIICPNDTTIQTSAASCGVNFDHGPPLITENCGTYTYSSSHPGQWYPVGSHAVELAVTDNHGNQSSCTFQVDVIDATGPELICHPDTVLSTDPGNCSAELEFPADATDACGPAQLAYSHAVNGYPIYPFPAGSTQVQVIATDVHGNSSTCTFNVEVLDAQEPWVQCPVDIETTVPFGACGKNVAYTASHNDNCGVLDAVWSIESGSYFTIGEHTVTRTITDAAGNISHCNFTITLLDNDTDGDGTGDCEDGCINDPLKTEPGICGCGEQDTDSDNDGLADCNDGCPLDPLKTSPGLCGCGTPDTDSDNNGSPDCLGDCVEQFYLNAVGNGSDVPKAILKTSSPTRTSLVNYDPNTDSDPGRMIKKGGSGVGTTDSDKYQLWSMAGAPIDGEVGLRFWSAMKDHDDDKGGKMRVFLADCGSGDNSCVSIASVTISRNKWHASNSSWVEENISFGHVAHSFSTGRRLAIKIIVLNDSDDDMWVAYDAIPFPAALSIGSNTDTDGDGIADCIDLCPNDPLKHAPGQCGCDQPDPGSDCDDGDPQTIDDKIQADCGCAGTPIDCAGTPNGTSYIDNCGNCVGEAIGVEPCTSDCAGEWGGTAYLDNCEICVEGSTGLMPCTADCAGEWGGTAYLDNCEICVEGSTGLNPCVADCAGEWGGTAYLDNCQTCVEGNTGLMPCTADCAGEWGGTAYLDNCQTCVEGSTGLMPCTADCNGEWGGTAYLDNCQTCVEGSTGLSPCIQDCLGIWGGLAVPGSMCDDGDPCTINDVITASCTCSGMPATPDATFHYASEEFCTNSSDPAPFVAAEGGLFAAVSEGLVVDPATGIIDLSASTAGTHTIKYYFTGACPNLYLNTIIINEPPASDWSVPDVICDNGGLIDLATLLATGTPADGIWTGPGIANGTLDPSGSTGTFHIGYTTTANGCSSTTEHAVSITSAPLAFAGEDLVSCGLTIDLQASAHASGHWTVPAGITILEPATPGSTAQAMEHGTYDLLWTVNNGGCGSSDTVTVTFIEPSTDLFADAGPDQRISIIKSTTLTGNTDLNASISWQVLEGAGVISDAHALHTTINGLSAGMNRVLLTAWTDPCNIASDTVSIWVDELFIPEGFSPNNDGINDLFEITGIDAYPNTVLRVFNRWGQEVFSSNDYRNGWDGRSDNGRELQNDTYFIVLEFGDGETHNGYVIIKR